MGGILAAQFFVVWLNWFNAELSPKRYWGWGGGGGGGRGPRSQAGEDGIIPNTTLSTPE